MPEPLAARRRRRWLYALAWLPYLTIYAAAFIANGVPPGPAVRNALANALPDALLGAVVLQLGGRLKWPEDRKGRFFAVHLGLGIAFILASSAGWLALWSADELVFNGSPWVHIDVRLLPWRVLNDALIYCTLIGISYAWHNAAAGREQAARAARADALRARAELEAIRSQLNPHFILNTFHALVGLVRREPALAEEALERLGDLLRYSLRVQREKLDEVALGDEWAFVKSYLDLERLRLGDRLHLSMEAPQTMLNCRVPSFALQTLVENAIRHAIAPRAAGGHLTVRVHQRNACLRIEVQDDGPGVDGQVAVEGQGLGLKLLQERLAALYDGQARLELNPTMTGGLCAVLELPLRYGDEEA